MVQKRIELLSDSDSSDSDSDLEFLAQNTVKPEIAPQNNVAPPSENYVPRSGPKFDVSRPSSASTPFYHMHHELDLEKCQLFLYPTSDNIETRDYQRNIIRKALVRNVLCVLPTGLGKTFIASTVMLNWYNWTKSAKIVFIAPTRPLVVQQAVGFLEATGISINDTIVLLNDVANKQDREEMWKKKRVIFATSQTVENDVNHEVVDPKEFVLLVVDEAHHAQKDHSYASLVRKVKNANPSLRILGLTATPSASLDQVQQMINDMDISVTEIRREESIDIQKYTRQRNIDRIRVDFSADQRALLKLLADCTRDQFELLRRVKICHERTFDVCDANSFVLRQELNRYMASDVARRTQQKAYLFYIRAVATQMATLAYNVSLLKEHGIMPFYTRMNKMELEMMGSKGKTAQRLLQSLEFKELMHKCRVLIYGTDRGATYRYEESERKMGFYSHPKLEEMVMKIDEFIGAHGADTRIIIFAEFRDSAAEILWMLKTFNSDTVRGSLFVGQATATNSEVKGMSQKEQRAVLEKFKAGEFNVLVATSIGEEGLDIGQVDLIICYDQSKSPIRNIQRIGRTGRKRTGNVIFFMTPQEERKLIFAFKNYSWICDKMNTSAATEDNYMSRDGDNNEVNLLMKLKYWPPNRMLPPEIEPKYTEIQVKQPPENEAVLCDEDNESNVINAMKDYVREHRKTLRGKPPKKKGRSGDQSSLYDVGFVNAADMIDLT